MFTAIILLVSAALVYAMSLGSIGDLKIVTPTNGVTILSGDSSIEMINKKTHKNEKIMVNVSFEESLEMLDANAQERLIAQTREFGKVLVVWNNKGYEKKFSIL